MRKKLNLVNCSNNELVKKEMYKVRGGCGCGCCYEGCGGSSSVDNACANADGGLTSPMKPCPCQER